MRATMFILFLSVLLLFLGYVLWHVWSILPFGKLGKWLVTILLAICVLSMFFFLGGKLDTMPLPIASACYEVSTSSLIVLLYLAIAFIFLDIARIVHILPSRLLHDSWIGTLSLLVVMTGIFVAGNIKYNNKVRVGLNLTTQKKLKKTYKMVMLSDLHLGYHNRRADLARWVDLINAENADIILIAGDIIDNSTRPIEEDQMAAELKRLNAPIYACLGNHEYFSNKLKAQEFYKTAGIHLLIDSTVVIGNEITIIGRDDRFNHDRKELKDLCKTVADSTYTIVLDHQPYDLKKAEECHIDFQLSGHTHRGQVWPISWITDAIYECSHGKYQLGNTLFYVSSGIGIWGGKFRIGTQSEYAVATLESNIIVKPDKI